MNISINITMTKARRIFFKAKNAGVQSKLSNICIPKNIYPEVFFFILIPKIYNNNAVIIVRYKNPQTGVNIQDGGLNTGLFNSLYQLKSNIIYSLLYLFANFQLPVQAKKESLF